MQVFKNSFYIVSLHCLPFVTILLNVKIYVKSAGCLHYAHVEHIIILFYQGFFLSRIPVLHCH